MGTARYAGVTLAAFLLGGAARAGALWLLSPAGRGKAAGVACGPLEIIFALFVFFHRAVPKLHPDYMRLGPLRFSDKSFSYFLGLQLLLHAGWGSVLPAATGLLVGTAAALAAPGSLLARTLVVPRPLARLSEAVIAPWWESRSSAGAGGAGGSRARTAHRGGQDDDAEAAALRQQMAMFAAMEGAGRRGGAFGAGAAPDPAAVARLVAMGFDEGAVREALARAGGDENAAANVLLGM